MFETKIPVQYSEAGQKTKEFLHTKLGARLGYALGVSGYNRIDAVVNRFKGYVKDGVKAIGKDFIARDERNGMLAVYSPAAVSHSYNSRVNKGADLIGSLITGTSLNSITSPLPPKYIALSTSSLTAAAGDTTLSGETSASGLARAAGTFGSYTGPASLDGAASFTVTKQFTAGATATIQSAALFDASSSGNMFVEANLSSSATVNSGDLLTITWTVNY